MPLSGASPAQVQEFRAGATQGTIQGAAIVVGVAATAAALRVNPQRAIEGGVLNATASVIVSGGQINADTAVAFGTGAVGGVAPPSASVQGAIAGAGNALGQLSQTGRVEPAPVIAATGSTALVERIVGDSVPGLGQAAGTMLKDVGGAKAEQYINKAIDAVSNGFKNMSNGPHATCTINGTHGQCQTN